MTVYVVQAMKGRNYSDAKNYGEVKVLLPAEEQIYEGRTKPVRDLRQRLAHFNPVEDYLLLSGDPIAIGLATAYVGKITTGYGKEINFLKWDRIDSKYNVVRLCL